MTTSETQPAMETYKIASFTISRLPSSAYHDKRYYPSIHSHSGSFTPLVGRLAKVGVSTWRKKWTPVVGDGDISTKAGWHGFRTHNVYFDCTNVDCPPFSYGRVARYKGSGDIHDINNYIITPQRFDEETLELCEKARFTRWNDVKALQNMLTPVSQAVRHLWIVMADLNAGRDTPTAKARDETRAAYVALGRALSAHQREVNFARLLVALVAHQRSRSPSHELARGYVNVIESTLADIDARELHPVREAGLVNKLVDKLADDEKIIDAQYDRWGVFTQDTTTPRFLAEYPGTGNKVKAMVSKALALVPPVPQSTPNPAPTTPPPAPDAPTGEHPAPTFK